MISYLKRTLLPVLSVLVVCLSGPAAAHPHGWIDLRSTVILNDNGDVVAIEQEWLFDELYSVFATDGWDMQSSAGKTALHMLAKGNLENLREYDYFTEILVDGDRQQPGEVLEFETDIRNARIWMRFIIPLDSPSDPKTRSFSYSVFDPTYYIEVLHMEGDVVAFRGPASGRCVGEISKPEPTFEAVSLAQSLAIDDEADDTLGHLFAERVDITCR